ncbi:T9SS-dependent choice-of-anchor J family protein [Winogradskyella thalassocola]|uniref:Por secretion system C-terminal sorting domain-containing protein n=1 Tax=Winogradskyella thalassocola TaxID=262004 RepID=A0A1G8IQE8_9FLAO|nr:choice-of-anchor J domain-containing protein [Winogradskyella thalassocola]SDI21268.1 Por secretion system C-terminal sorting domain-containing protein [Winogradskyella thalassocola]
MKKITLMLFALIAFCWQSNAQFTENFDASTDLPTGWSIINQGGANEWTIFNQSTTAFSGTNYARIQYNLAAHDDYLIAPAITVTAGVNDRVSFYIKSMNSGYLEPYEVRLSTDSNTLDTDFSVVLQAEEEASTTWTMKEFDLTAYIGQTVYIAIRATGTNEDRLAVDDFVSDAIPSCYAAEFASAVAVDDCDNSQFSILVDITDLGSSVNLEITNDAGVASTTVTATGEVTVGPFPAGTPVVLTLENENEDTCDVVLDSVLDFCPTAANTLDYYNLQWPAALTFPENEAADQMVYAQAYEAGLTDIAVGEAAAGIEAWIGYSTTDTDPSTEDWTWEVAPFVSEEGTNGNNDQFAVAMQDLGLTEGTYYYASRFTLNAGPYMYGGFEGAWDATTNPSGVLTITAALPPANDDFANAIAVACGDVVSEDTTFATLDEDDATVDITTNADIDSPNVWYSFMGTGDIVTASTCMNTDFDTELFVFTGTSGSLVAVAAGYDECGGSAVNYTAETTFTSVAGTQYYISVEGYNVGSVGTFELAVTCEAPPTCTNATATYSVVSDCETSGGFNIEVDITDMGTATAVTITDDQGNDAQAATEATMLTFGPYTNATDVIITIADDNDATCEQSSDAMTQLACPPANDDCAGAQVLTVENEIADLASATQIAGSIVGATGSGIDVCTYGGTANDDVWFSFVATSTDININVTDDFDGMIEVFSGACGSLVAIECDDYGGPSGNPSISRTDYVVDETYYLRVYNYSATVSATPDFTIALWSSEEALGINDFETEAAFTYYPNPVKNTLTLNAQNTIEQVAMYNMLGQEVLRATPNSVDSDLDMSHLQTGTYFVKVTIANVTETIRVIKQ